MSEEKISGITRWAILKFEEVARAERRLSKKDQQLNALVTQIPEEEMDYYVKATDKIQYMLDNRRER